jgi:WD40 repeat protein
MENINENSDELRNIETEILEMSFNLDNTILSIGTENGFILYNTIPFYIICSQNLGGGIKQVEVLGGEGNLFLLGGGNHPKFLKNLVILWNYPQKKLISFIKMQHTIKNIKCNSYHLFVIIKNKIFCFDSQTLKEIDSHETMEDNNKGIFSMNVVNNTSIIAFPGQKKGDIHIYRYDIKKLDIIHAHSTRISCINLNNNGTLLATASDNGTLIRIFKVNSGELYREFRRGKDKAEIFSLSFSNQNEFLCITSDRKTVHIFNLVQEYENDNEDKPKIVPESKGVIGNLKKIFYRVPSSFVKLERSFALYRINELKSICTFGESDNLFVVSYDDKGKFYHINFDKKNGGETKDAKIYSILYKKKNEKE